MLTVPEAWQCGMAAGRGPEAESGLGQRRGELRHLGLARPAWNEKRGGKEASVCRVRK